MKEYKYCYLIIPTINGSINGYPKVYFTNLDYYSYIELELIEESTVYKINLKNYSVEELK